MRSSAVLLACLFAAGCAAPSFNGVVLDPPDAAPALRLADSTGTAFDLGAQRGQVVMVFFGYTHCPDVCPTTLVEWKRAATALGDAAQRVRFVFVSVDPERDTPAGAQRYAAGFSPTFTGLTGTRAQIDATLATWKLAAYRDGNPADTSTTYTVSHPSQVFVIDPEGRLRLMHRAGLTPAQIADDIRALL
ncbi:MAG: SCO family protein [Gemmatimonadaceae bacterium]|nr:SCO family protein [Gemmatimonadaceae bacterium]